MVTGLRKQVCFAPCLYVMSVRFTELAISALGTQETVAPNDICLAYDNFLILYLPQYDH